MQTGLRGRAIARAAPGSAAVRSPIESQIFDPFQCCIVFKLLVFLACDLLAGSILNSDLYYTASESL